jgi:hypothetical protein
MTPAQRARLGALWKEKERLHLKMKIRGRSFIRILEDTAAERDENARDGNDSR